MDSRDVQLIFKIDINQFAKSFILDAYRECKLHVEDLITKKLEEVQLKIPEEINEATFITFCELFEQYEDLKGLWNNYSSDGQSLILDKVIYIMMRHRIVRPDFNFTESD